MLKDYVKCGKMHPSITTIGTSPGGYTRSIHDRGGEGATYFYGVESLPLGYFLGGQEACHIFY